ncbi:MAG TPA: O-antigen ligase family protein [Gaiellaceae bacterium]|nr:O-antigen ligase family protein [Gaiellaceae bacterium]
MRKATSALFLASVFCVTFEKIHWTPIGSVGIADVFAILFLVSFALTTRTWRVPRTTAVLLGFFAVFLAAYLIGYFDIQNSDATGQFAKGMIKWIIHFAFLAAAVVWLARRGQGYYWRTLGWFSGGIVTNAAYGVLQLLDARRGGNLDASVLSPITGGASQINVYGAINGASVFRPNAMTGDPNHLGIMLIVPLLILTPIYLRMEKGRRLRLWLMAAIGFLLIVEAATLSRSGLLGLGVGALILAVPYRHYLKSPKLLLPIGAAALVLAGIVASNPSFFTQVIKSRVQTGGGSENVHLSVYGFIPQILHTEPLFGLGLNTFSVYYEFITGKSNWGPHSYYVSLIVETGLVGTVLFAAFILWVFHRLAVARAIGRAMTAAGDPLAARVRPLAWGCTAALAGTLASNAFYLTMQFYYFFLLIALSLAVPVVFARE